MKRTLTRTLVTIIAVVLMVPAGVMSAPRSAHAQVAVLDIYQNIKDGALDMVAWTLAKVAISSIMRSTINWVNSGFEGSPAFVTDLQRNLLRVGDIVASRLVQDIAEGVIDSPYAEEVSAAVRVGYYLSTGNTPFYVRYPYTLNAYSNDPTAFIAGDFSQGGYNALFSTFANPQNNPYGAYDIALQELNSRLSNAQGTRREELNWGDGFLSFRDCQGGNNIEVQLAGSNDCFATSIKTPGSVIAPQLNKAIGAPIDGLVEADEINELIGALLQQLVSKVLGSGGLIGVSQQASGGGRPFLDDATDPGQYQPPETPTNPIPGTTDI